VQAGQTVLVLGASGSVGAYAMQFAVSAGLHVIATARAQDAEFVRSLGAELVVDYERERFDEAIPFVDVIVDLVGGETLARCFPRLKDGGILVSVVSGEALPQRSRVRSIFFYAEVTTDRLNTISAWLDRGQLAVHVGTVLPLERVREAHEMLGGAPHKRGKIVLVAR